MTGADVVITMLFDADAVLDVAGELTDALGPDAVWLQSATVGPEGIARIAQAAGDTQLVDAPMLGTKQPAEQGKLVARVRPAGAHRAGAAGARRGRRQDRRGRHRAGQGQCAQAGLQRLGPVDHRRTAQSVSLAQGLGVDPSCSCRPSRAAPRTRRTRSSRAAR